MSQTIVKTSNDPMFMKTLRVAFVSCLSAAIWLAAGRLDARDQTLRFLHALQEHGYGDMAVEYLTSIERDAGLSPAVRESWDLEMSKSLKIAAAEAFDAKEYEALMERSQKYLAKFIKEKPDHPDAVIATAAWGDFLAKRAVELIQSAKLVESKDKAQRDGLLTEARSNLAGARDKFQQAEKKFADQLADIPAVKQNAKKVERAEVAEARQRIETNIGESRLQLALIEYYLAQTYADPKDAARLKTLGAAAKALDALYQKNRGNLVGVWAHTWHGKTVEELGDIQTALDIYDEVLANAPEPSERGPATGLEPLFAQVEQFRLEIVAKQKPDQFLKEAAAWMKEHRKLRNTDGYQGIALAAARALFAAAQKATGPEKNKLTSDAMQLANECSRVRSRHQREFVLIRREILKKTGRELEIKSFDEAVSLGDAAATDSQWDQSLAAYAKALELARKTKLNNSAAIAAVREAMGRVQLMTARGLFDKGKFDDCIAAVNKIVVDQDGEVKKGSEAAAAASALGVSAALNIYVAADQDKKPAALDKLTKAAEFTEKNWSDRPEADDARVARGQAKIAVGNFREAIDIFDRVNPKSERYAAAMFMAGQNYWRLYLTEKSKDAEPVDKDRMAADRAKAEERLSTALDAFKRQSESSKPMPKPMFETQLLLAEVLYEKGDAKKAASLYQPLVDQIRAEKPKSFDINTIRVFLGVVRAYCLLGRIDRAGEAGNLLMELGADSPQVNEVLVEFAKLLNLERKKSDAQGVGKLLGDTLVKLSRRKELTLAQMMFIGQTLNAIGMTDEAGLQFQRIVKRAETDEEFGKQAQKAMSLIRTELLKNLRTQQRYEEAVKQVDQLIKENPRALEPLMEKGRILDALAEKEPGKYEQAVAHWSSLRTKLQRMKRKPDEYYDVVYNIANCLVREAEASKDKSVVDDRAKKAEQVLKSAMILSPRLNGPDAVVRYKVLLDKAIDIQGRRGDQQPVGKK